MSDGHVAPAVTASAVTATAGSHPCELHRYHAPEPSRTQFHHQKPIYLQERVWGEVREGPSLWVCGTCHDSVHDWISFLLGEARRPVPEPGRLARAEAERTVAWYRSATEAAGGDLSAAPPSAG